jgi:hypothetical protein
MTLTPTSPTGAAHNRFRLRQGLLRQALFNLHARLEHEVGPLMGSLFPGEIRSRYRAFHGLERDIPDVFRPGDDARQIDFHHLPATLAFYNLETAILRQELRRERFTHYSDSELIVIADLSRSMLSGCLGQGGPPAAFQAGDKLWGLYLAMTLFLVLGEQAGFVLRVVFARNGAGEFERAMHPREFRLLVLERMSEELVQSYARMDAHPKDQEKFSLRWGLESALDVRTRSVIVVISDFLDPWAHPNDGYREHLLEAMARHHVVLVDVASARDIHWPPPVRLWSCRPLEYLRSRQDTEQQSREAVRHLEKGTELDHIAPAAIRQWNQRATECRMHLKDTASRCGAGFSENFRKLTMVQGLAAVSEHLGLAGC